MENFRVFLAFAVIITLASVCVTKQVVDAHDPPIILGNERERVVTVGHNITLQCVGKKPLTWDLPQNWEGEPAISIISTSESADDNYPYGLLLELFSLSAVDVGNYTCLFNETNGDYSLEEREEKGDAVKVYIYVDDPNTLLVPMEAIISGIQYMPLTIPCRPTAPNVQVKLYYGETEITSDVKYDPQNGFTIVVNSIADNTYKCVFIRDTEQIEHHIIVQLAYYTNSVHKPSVSDSFNGKTAVDGNISLNCRIILDKGIPFQLIWKYPESVSAKRVFITNTTSKYVDGQNNLPQIMGESNLTVINVTSGDEGRYTCKILDANKHKSEESKDIKVLEKGSSHLHLEERAGHYNPTIRVGKIAKMIVKIDAYPTPEIFWTNNQNKPIATDSHSGKYSVNISDYTTALHIRNITLEDRGVYRVVGNSINITKTLNFTLTVESPPVVNLDAKKFYMQGTIASIPCTVRGFPISTIKWYYQECVNTDSQCKSSITEIKNQNYTNFKEDDVTVKTILGMYIDKPGTLTCSGYNKIGEAINASSVVYAAEIENGFGITISHTNLIADGDNVSLTCIASIFTYPNTTLKWYRMPGNQKIGPDISNVYNTKRYSTKYSNKLVLLIPNISKNESGTYQCRIESNDTETQNDVEKDTIKINVKDLEKPNIDVTNMNDSVVQFALGQPNVQFECKARGIPVPEMEWYKDEKQIVESNQRINLTKNGTLLVFTHIKEEDEGKYKCVAKNRIGFSEKYIQLSIEHGKFKLMYLIVILILLGVFVILITVLLYKIKKEKEIRNELRKMGLTHFEGGATECLNPDLGVDDQAELLPYDKKWEFPREKLKLGKQLGSGAFGVVMKATAHGILVEEEATTVAVKMVKRTADHTFIKALASELKIMVHLGKHVNVVNLLGACTKNVTKRELLVIVEYCRYGNLHNYLIRHRGNFIDQIDPHSGNIDSNIGSDVINRAYSVSSNKSSGLKSVMQPLLSRSSYSREDSIMDSGALDTANTAISMVPTGYDGMVTSSGSVQPEWRSNYRGDYNYNKDVRPISTQDLLGWSFQVARGMEYLANRKVLHGDLAARNILLADNNVVKICDFGLAKNMYKTDNYKKKGDGPFPVKWMAVESIRDRIFSTQSDVWSYGIVLWELFSLASTPYPGMEPDEKFYNKLVEGYRMEKPNYSNKRIYSIMLECWRARPIQRPSFTQLAEKLGDLLEDGVRKHYIDLNDPYVDMNNRWLAESGQNDFLSMMCAPDYGNLTSANQKHDYVNEPFGGPTSVNPMSPDDTDAEGYLCMSPAKNGVVSKESQIFNFSQINSESDNQNNEWVPMLTNENQIQRPRSDSGIVSKPGSPNVDGNSEELGETSFSNPTYKPTLKSIDKKYPDDLLIVNDNYIDMSHKDSGFCDNVVIDENISAFSNPSYVTMNTNSDQNS
ncbi:vascular endothelial growth factor receptor 1-like [Arctopsyche grandis]|uniref:vascular endothelial growth factor receptor 1-like n=1 Tax=Arctopsyche grandis TaxID=121162 RepID=UPI00406D6A3D